MLTLRSPAGITDNFLKYFLCGPNETSLKIIGAQEEKERNTVMPTTFLFYNHVKDRYNVLVYIRAPSLQTVCNIQKDTESIVTSHNIVF